MKRFIRAIDRVLRILLGVLFGYAGIAKLVLPLEFLRVVYAWQIVGPPWGRVVAAGVPAIELVVGICLVIGAFRKASLAIASALLATFVIAQVAVLMRGLSASCGCFGGVESVSWFTVARTATLLAAAAALFAANGDRESTRRKQKRDYVTAALDAPIT